MTKKDLFNAKHSSNRLESGMELNVVDIDTFPDTDKDGNNVTVTCLKDENGKIYTTISSTIAGAANMLREILDEEEKVTVKVCIGTSNNGREFMRLEIL